MSDDKHIGTENLIPLNQRTKEEQREIARMGGIKSGEVRREKKLLSQMYADYLGHKDMTEYFNAIIERKDSASVSLIKEMREGTEGNKVKVETESKEKPIIPVDEEKAERLKEIIGLMNGK